MSKEIKNEDGTIEFKKSMTVEETRSMTEDSEIDARDYINLFTEMKNEDERKK